MKAPLLGDLNKGVEEPQCQFVARTTANKWAWIAFIIVILPLVILLMSDILLFGADEELHLMQGLLLHKGFGLYNQIWCNQPPLYTYTLKSIFGVFGESAFWPRILSIAATGACGFILFRMTVACGGGLIGGLFSAILLVGAPTWVQLGVSAMQEIPMLALSLVSTYLLVASKSCTFGHYRIILAGFLMGAAIEVKFTAVLLFASAVMAVFARGVQEHEPVANLSRTLLLYCSSCILAVITLMICLGSGSFSLMAKQHFESTPNVPPGFPSPYMFHPTIGMVKAHWDIFLGGAIGLIWLVLRKPKSSTEWFCLSSFVVFGTFALFYRPWWDYFLCCSSIPLILLASISIGRLAEQEIRAIQFLRNRTMRPAALLIFFVLAFLLQIPGYERLSNCLSAFESYDKASGSHEALRQVLKNKGNARWILTDAPIIAFHAGLLVPPQVAALPFKRVWSGEPLSDLALDAMHQYHPELILTINSSLLQPFDRCVLEGGYQLVWKSQYYSLFRRGT